MLWFYFYYLLFFVWGVVVFLSLFTWCNLMLNMSSADKTLVTCIFRITCSKILKTEKSFIEICFLQILLVYIGSFWWKIAICLYLSCFVWRNLDIWFCLFPLFIHKDNNLIGPNIVSFINSGGFFIQSTKMFAFQCT